MKFYCLTELYRNYDCYSIDNNVYHFKTLEEGKAKFYEICDYYIDICLQEDVSYGDYINKEKTEYSFDAYLENNFRINIDLKEIVL